MRLSLRHFALALLGVAGVLLLAIVLYLAFGDLSRHKDRIEAFVTQQIGRPFAIDGAFRLQLLPTVEILAERVHVGNAPWGSAPRMLEVGRFHIEIAPASLIFGPVDVHALELSDVSAVLEKRPDAAGNWKLGETSGAAQSAAIALVVRSGTLRNVRIAFSEHGNPERVALVESLSIAAGPTGQVSVSGRGRLDDAPVTVSGDLGTLDSLLAGRDLRVALQAAMGDLHVDLRGALRRIRPLDGADLTLKVEHPDVASLLQQFGAPALATGALRLNARLSDVGERTRLEAEAKLGDSAATLSGTLRTLGLEGSDLRVGFAAPSLARLRPGLPAIPVSLAATYAGGAEAIELKDLVGQLGASELSGRMLLARSGRPRIELELASPRLDLTPFLAAPDDERARAKSPAGRFVFDEAPLPLDMLQGVDARLHLAAAELHLLSGWFRDVDGTLVIEDGRLALAVRAQGGVQGTLEGSVTLALAGGDGAELQIEISAQDLRAGFEAGRTIRPDQVPPTSVEAKLRAKGATARQMASGASGRIVVTQKPGKIETGIVTQLGDDVLSELAGKVNPFASKDPYSVLECTVVRADIVAGEATVRPFVFQTEKVAVVADGRIDLRTEAVALGFSTRPRKGVGISTGMFTNPFIELAGTLSSPSIGFGARGAASGAAAVATGGMSVLAQGLFDRLRGVQDQCPSALAEAAAGR
jgi:uncharacterized protein involved in outer membrane biogenesis